MTTQKKVNRKRNVHFRVLLILFSLAGCSTSKEQSTGCSKEKNLTLEIFKTEIHAGLTTDKVKQKIGVPNKVETNNEKVIKQRKQDAQTSIDLWPSEDSEYYTKFFGGDEKEYLKKLREKEKTIYYEYIYFDEESNQEEQFFVYFIDGKVAWMSFPKKKV